ncbi:hypothetical protein HPB47_019322 [Ixodes persulcatus]|uniref:Uncharacterized protein n=1 Tax=Ixodes persulcatus TaxID=34615 RepID=A0AC60QL22_IXOPE|nr:hypothetical protein HPB47_019322 [Ixodes persulcatus]
MRGGTGEKRKKWQGERTYAGLAAVYEGDGPFDFSWTKDGLLLRSPHRATIRQFTESSSLLTLEAVTVGDIGNYTCVVSSPAGSDSYTAALSVRVAPKLQDFSFPSHVALGKRAQVNCAVYEGQGPLTFFWRKDGALLASGQETSIRQTTDLTSLLTLDSVSVQSIGNYTCVVNGPGGSDSYTAILSVKGSSTLTIRRIEPGDIGNYTCIASSVQGSSEITVPLTVLGAPNVHSSGFPPDLTLGDDTGAYCVVRKDDFGPASISWSKDGVEMKSNDRVTVTMQTTSSSTLTIRRIEPGDIGNYTCIASSVQGSSEITVSLTILGNGPFTFTWKKDGLPLEPGPGTTIRQVTDATSLLMLDAVTVGNYTCVVSSGAGSDS